MKKSTIIFSLILVAAAAFVTYPAYALYGINPTKIQERMDNRASRAAQIQNNELAKIISTSDTMIANRIQSLQNLLARIANDTRLTVDEKSGLTTDINTTIADLTALKAKIDADTDVATAKADRKSIVTSYHIYIMYDPKVRLSIVIDNLMTASSNVSSLSGQVQTLLNEFKSQGKDVTSAQNDLNDINTTLTTINTTLSTDKSLLAGLSASTANPQSVTTQVRKDLAGVRSDFASIKNDFEMLRVALKPVLGSKPTTTPSPTQ